MTVTHTNFTAARDWLTQMGAGAEEAGVTLQYCMSLPRHVLQSSEVASVRQSGALSLVGRVEILLSLVETFIELKYFHDVAMPALLCHKEPACHIMLLKGKRQLSYAL